MWLSVAIATDAGHAEALSDALLALGALSVSIEDADVGTERETPQFGEPGSATAPLWAHSRVLALFEKNADIPVVVAAAAGEAGLAATPPCEITEVAEQDWVRLTQSQFEPIRVNERLWIVPSWHLKDFEEETAPPPGRPKAGPANDTERSEQPSPPSPGRGAGGRCIVQLDPGLAFGTGSHPTTRLCLEWLCAHVQTGAGVLDYGCGSGILAIAAAKLGAGRVVGVDIDENALAAAADNARKNGVILQLLHSKNPLDMSFDIVVANILTNPLCVLAPLLSGRTRPGGQIALSGILSSQAGLVQQAYRPAFDLAVRGEREGWVLLTGTRKC